MPDAINFKMTPNIIPINTPQPAFKALSLCLPISISPTTAPMKAPIIIPKGGAKRIPSIIPIIAPQKPNFEAPYFLAPAAGIT